ncbi:MAG: PleD family two-component system response regulator [Heteroscytonema crispum UTEX LB 1556]
MDLSCACENHLYHAQMRSPILVVDGDNDNLKLLIEILKMLGFCAIAATDGETALRIAIEQQPALILLEVVLPQMDGISIVRHLRKNGNFVPMIMITSLPGCLYQEQAFLAGCNKYIEKPFNFEELEAAIYRYLHLSPSCFSLLG